MARTFTVATFLLVGIALGVLVASGALAGGGTSDRQASESASPDRPSPLTMENVDDYAVAYERVTVYESIDDGTVRSLDLACDASVSQRPSSPGYLVALDCAYSYEGELDGHPYIADGAPYTVTYRIDTETTERGEVRYGYPSSAGE